MLRASSAFMAVKTASSTRARKRSSREQTSPAPFIALSRKRDGTAMLEPAPQPGELLRLRRRGPHQKRAPSPGLGRVILYVRPVVVRVADVGPPTLPIIEMNGSRRRAAVATSARIGAAAGFPAGLGTPFGGDDSRNSIAGRVATLAGDFRDHAGHAKAACETLGGGLPKAYFA